MRRHHKVLIGTFGTLVTIFMVVTAFILNGIILKQNIENQELKNEILELEERSSRQLSELSIELIKTKKSINEDLLGINQDLMDTSEELSLLKVETNGDFSGVVEESIKSIVVVRTLSGQGSGFFINGGGYLVTNAHVLATSTGHLSSIINVIKSDGKTYSANFIGYVQELDLALLRINYPTSYLKLEKSNNVEIGEKVVAIGTPQGLSFSVTDGIVSATNRIEPATGASYVQTNAELNPGNSGGPLINKEGKVVGMNNFKFTDSEGIGFALEADEIKKGVNQISQSVLEKDLIS